MIKSGLVAMLSAALATILPTSYASPSSDILETTPMPNLHARSNSIRLELGTERVNVGSLFGGALYDKIYQAIHTACPPGFESKKCSQTQAKFAVGGERNGKLSSEDLVVQINWADWLESEQVYNLLRGAVAGAVERGALKMASPKNCRFFVEKISQISYWHCNTLNFVGVFLPNGASMGVSLKSYEAGGEFDCGMTRATVSAYVEKLRGEVEQVIHDDIGNLDVVCCYDLASCKEYAKVRQ